MPGHSHERNRKAGSFGVNQQSYAPIEIPHERFDPLTILGGESPSSLEPFGSLKDILVPGAALPEILRDDAAATISDRRAERIDAKFGLNLLRKILQAFGGTGAKASAAYERATTFECLYSDAMQDSVYLIPLLKALDEKSVEAATLASIAGAPYLYIVTDTLKSSKFGLAAYDASGAGIDLSADAIQNVLGASVGVHAAGGANHVVTYSGEKHLRFAFRAKRLTFDAATKKITLSFSGGRLASKFVHALSAEMPPEAFDLPVAAEYVSIAER